MGALHAGLPTPTTCAAALEPRGGKGGEGSEPQLLSPAGPAFPTCKCSVTLRFNFLLFLILFSSYDMARNISSWMVSSWRGIRERIC